MGDRAGSTTPTPRPQRITDSIDLADTGIPALTQHTITARRASDPPNCQPRLDADRISLYRHHQCLQALQRGTPQASQDFGGVPRTHQFLVTLMVHTNQINPASTPAAASATSMTNAYPVVVIPRDGQQTGHPDRRTL
ncbi:hypothetical protein [Mycobacterium pseudokansasii]|uniref:hypothetical protein n=1 Tax=Mycobacterium pseudokansasii TaxID=2341080 RepID=UPI00142DD501|nr:hypothetical protein [Mycobacterium pseudokansasii]